ncbi:hypothetical protein C9I50_10010 [Pseudomonas prosekii]|nr:hypothetical protein C9I50_10010 [Pseudomonas prosekii]
MDCPAQFYCGERQVPVSHGTAILVGASLLAIAVWQATHALNVRPSSRASSLPQVRTASGFRY